MLACYQRAHLLVVKYPRGEETGNNVIENDVIASQGFRRQPGGLGAATLSFVALWLHRTGTEALDRASHGGDTQKNA